MKSNKGFVMSTYVYILLTFFLLILVTMLLVLNNSKLISNKIKNQANDLYSGIEYVKKFPYTGSYQEFEVPYTGRYSIELWGAEGGSAVYKKQYYGGKGAYTKGEIHLEVGEKLYIYVGGKGGGTVVGGTNGYEDTYNGYNGGGYGSAYLNTSGAYTGHGGGGGATDIRYFGSATPTSNDLKWNSNLGLNSRIMVAAGGGGAASHNGTPNYSGTGGNAGGLNGYAAVSASNSCYSKGDGAKQITNGGHITCTTAGHEYGSSTAHEYAGEAGFGFGGNYSEFKSTNAAPRHTNSGGGSGYYGGGAGWYAPGGGGSSYISGHNGCVAITSSTNRSPKSGCKDGTDVINCSYHYSDKIFTNTVMIDGAGYNWTTTKGSYVGQIQQNGTTKAGHSGNGYAIITYIGK